MTRRVPLRWKLLLAFCITGTLASLAAWAFLLSTLCSNPRTPMPETEHVIPYHCHGMTVFISHFENAMLHWFAPIEGLFILLSVLAAVRVAFAVANVRVNVQVQITDTSSRKTDGK